MMTDHHLSDHNGCIIWISIQIGAAKMNQRPKSTRAVNYQIRVEGRLDPNWSDWFDGFTIAPQADETLLTGPVTDQAALHGILAKLNDLHLEVLSLERLESKVWEDKEDSNV